MDRKEGGTMASTYRTGKILMFVSLLMICFSFYRGCVNHGKTSDYQYQITIKTIDQFEDELKKWVDHILASPDHGWRKYIESAHLTVKVSRAYVRKCTATTKDGSCLTGENNSNIDEVVLVVRFFWDGFIDSGHTDLEMKIDWQEEKCLTAKIIDTTALVNLQDPSFWTGLAGCLFAL